MSCIRVYARQWAVRSLGPGVRYVLWTQGCDQRCPGCVSPETQNLDGGEYISTGAIAWEVYASGARGMTISGGEPFLQADALCEMLDAVRNLTDVGVICYTGHTYEGLCHYPAARRLLNRIDLLIDGPYVQELDDGRPLRGSSNQRLIHLTDRYKGIEEAYKASAREQESFWEPGGVGQAGIPTH